MNRHAAIIVFYLFSQFFFLDHVFSQVIEKDTSAIITSYSEELARLLEIQKQDSIKRLELENQILKSDIRNSKEYKELNNQINLLKNKDSLLQVRKLQKIDSLKILNKGDAVMPFDSVLFYIYTNIGSFSASDRAKTITERIRNLTDDVKFNPDSLMLGEDEGGIIIRWRDQMLMTINDTDALWMGGDKNTLANQYLETIKASINTYRTENSLKQMLINYSLAFLILTVLGFVIYGLQKVFVMAKSWVIQRKETKFKGIYIKNYELVSNKQIIRLLWMIIDVLKWVTTLIVVYLALPLLFNLFPATEGYAPILLDYVTRPLHKIGTAVVASIPNMITIIIIILLFKYLLKLLNYFANEIQSGALTITGFYQEWAIPTYQILKVLLLAFMLIIIFPYLPGSESPIFKGVSVFIGVLFTFGSTGAISNIIAGLVLTYMRSFSLGDRIKIGDVTGDVIEKSLLVTRVRTIKNEVISIPNSQVMNSHTVNYSINDLGCGLIIHTDITISYDTPWQLVHELAIKAALNVELLEKEPRPFVFQSQLNEFYVTYQINAYTQKPNMQALIYSELHKQILDVFHEAGVELLSFHYNAWRDSSDLKIPKK